MLPSLAELWFQNYLSFSQPAIVFPKIVKLIFTENKAELDQNFSE
jgi:hypothetical protein